MKTISFIGAGNVAFHLAKGLYRVGYGVKQVFSGTREKAAALADAVDAEPVNQWHAIEGGVDLLIIAIRDDVLARVDQHWQVNDQTLVVHTSGSVRAEVLASCARNWGVFYPLQTFSKDRSLTMANVPFCLEANTPGNLKQLKEVCGDLGASCYEVESAQRQSLHLAGVMVNNFSNYLLTMAYGLLKDNGLPFGLLKPLASETVEKAFDLGPENAQTGPAKRGDWEIVKKHLAQLTEEEQKQLYEKLSEAIYHHHHS